MNRINGCKFSRLQQSGMTLLELMVLVAIAASLTWVGVSSYQSWVQSQHRQQAVSDLNTMQIQISKQFNGSHQWQNIVSNGKCLVCFTSESAYHYSITSAAGFTITAKPQGTQSQDSCGNIHLKANGKMHYSGC
ncbi:type IV pilin protein [Vibrio sp. SCSIO 43136]|uniref:type IV pilin protein n=1 Tax=Vibrio sp. SCSIO 43136 TaxID=2819101 RepID=UPI002074C5E2|nr:type IV pilin protein [Vibrio sp. SCSIO 43136]USD65844.1 hypothetical protein J4N39_03195 [Vibrio sp. SCSIO 43136]